MRAQILSFSENIQDCRGVLSIAAHPVIVASPESRYARGTPVRRQTLPAKEMQISLF